MLEIERKFLVREVPADKDWPVEFVDFHLVQVYLTPKDKRVTSERVRVTIPTNQFGPAWTHTTKVRVAAGIHEEEERSLSKSAFTRMLRRADPAMKPVQKMRRKFYWPETGRLFELDIFAESYAPLVLLEVELPSMDTPVELPTFLTIEREVTEEKGFSNAALARMGAYKP